MKKLVYILLAVVVFLSFTAVNILAGEVDKAKQGEIEFAKAVANNDCDLNIDAKVVSDDEMKSIVGTQIIDPVDGGRPYKMYYDNHGNYLYVARYEYIGNKWVIVGSNIYVGNFG